MQEALSYTAGSLKLLMHEAVCGALWALRSVGLCGLTGIFEERPIKALLSKQLSLLKAVISKAGLHYVKQHCVR